jgi:hypothetical protein
VCGNVKHAVIAPFGRVAGLRSTQVHGRRLQLGVEMMQRWIAGHAAAVLEQAGVVRRDALQERFHGPLDLRVADGRVAEEDAVVNQRTDHIEDQRDVDLVTEVPSRLGPFEGLSDGRARGIEQRDHERVAQLAIAGAVGE